VQTKKLQSNFQDIDEETQNEFLTYVSYQLEKCHNCGSEDIGSFPNPLSVKGGDVSYDYDNDNTIESVSAPDKSDFSLILCALVCMTCFYVHLFEKLSMWRKFIEQKERLEGADTKKKSFSRKEKSDD